MGESAPAAVALCGVRVDAGRARLLDGVDARFAAGRVTAVLGPNGAGKSTLVRVATGLVRPAAGSVTYAGRPVAAFAPAELARRRAVLSQSVAPAFPLAARDVVRLGRFPHRGTAATPRAEAERDRRAVDAALARVGLTARADQPYATLSGGERQKVHLARVLAQLDAGDGAVADASAPRVLFLDEPTASLDVHDQLAVLDLARDVARRGGAVVAVLHDLNVALRYADAVVVLDRGRVAYAGDDPALVPPALLGRVFRVRLHPLSDPAAGAGGAGPAAWRFTRADAGAPALAPGAALRDPPA